MALIGGHAYCGVCKTTGVTSESSGLHRILFISGTAADGDVVFCKCPTPPRIVAELAGEAWCSNDDDPSMISLQETVDLTAPADQATSLSATGSFVTFDEQVILEVSTGK